MATPQHHIWASGHFLLLLCSLRYVASSLTLGAASPWWYKASFVGAIVSYAIVCLKSLGIPQPNFTFIRRALIDENVQYFLLAFFWFTSTPITIALLPYMIFSLFHALTFIRTNLFDKPPPNAPPHPVARRLQVWVKANYDSAMRIVAYTEIVIFIRVFLGAVTFQNSLIAPIIYIHFLRTRYFQSAFTREAIANWGGKVDAYVRRPGNPPALVSAWDQAQGLMKRWAGVVLTPNDQDAAPAGAR